ncbi:MULTISPECIES: carbohydrate binding domain-containing protein [unclassified Paenibacillus]|uniref:carbohydrate binding domain-containing protein n=1 Tax=unclassified Paenibacillus TaxID=185978 RepID=UPI00095525D4|nr:MULTISPECIES: carbohydrate binding domain-containing protein [unclassified Paenibacillus]ASS66823.1 alpha-amylase [Paenibacillus sp. RUD330]SIP94341.1 Glycosidase [Paenibacillus sp. RU4X]SIQ12785.1 Glycosidase [Paenibacillus sp. RU4T]
MTRSLWSSLLALALLCGLVFSPGSFPAPAAAADAQPAASTAEIFYYLPSGWSKANLHHNAGGAWTAVPGTAMEAGCTNWVRQTVTLSASAFEFVFNNNAGIWDNNNGSNYKAGAGVHQVKNGQLLTGAGSPCAAPTTTPSPTSSATPSPTASSTPSTTPSSTPSTTPSPSPTATPSPSPTATPSPSPGKTAVVYYKAASAWTAVNIHYAVGGGSWTAVPGTPMALSCDGWWKKEIDLGTSASMKAAFNNGSGTWDNNNGGDYAVGAGTTTIKDRVLTAGAPVPCTPAPPDTTAPSVPQSVTAAASGLSIRIAWSASTDNAGGTGVGGYELVRSGGTSGPKTFVVTGTSFSDSSLEAKTAYSYTVKAFDLASPPNKSAASAPASATTGDAPPPAPGGTPIGTDMREDSIYFVMTARFYDGDSSNNMGGQLNVSSGNAAGNDPMFRGDFKGLMDKLDYIKALGFSAIWITPVVLNRSDYDFHGYHGYDFYRVDPRLESPGASYQELINAAHNKGIKIIQDVVYNHSSRWGAKGLFTPTVFGVRDSQWSWYYDEKVPGKEYNGLAPEGVSAKAYNGDMWSTAEPVGNKCLNWGTPTSYKSKEGYTIYNCQWPSPTSGMFPAEYYHQCWIGNWEGEDSRSCWLHEDLADFNTESKPVQDYLIGAYNKFIDMGVDGFRIDTAVHVPRVTWNRRFLPAALEHSQQQFGDKGKNFYMAGEVGAFVNDKWNRGSVNHSAQFYTWKERKTYSADDAAASIEQYNYEEQLGTGNQPTSSNAFLNGNAYHAPDHSQFSGMNIIDMRMHMNFSEAQNAFNNGKESDDSTNDATYNMVYVDSHDFGPNKSSTAYAGGTDAWAENMSLMWTFRGIPTLYMGSEIEFQAGKQIDCGPTCPLSTTRRAYFGDKLEGSVSASSFGKADSATGTVAQTLSYPLVKHIQRLNQIRRAIPALQKGQYSTEGVSGSMAYKRRYTDAASGIDSFALVTVSGSATFTGIPNGTYKDAITGQSLAVSNGTLTASVSGKGNLRVFVLDLPGNPAPGKIGDNGPYLKP